MALAARAYAARPDDALLAPERIREKMQSRHLDAVIDALLSSADVLLAADKGTRGRPDHAAGTRASPAPYRGRGRRTDGWPW